MVWAACLALVVWGLAAGTRLTPQQRHHRSGQKSDIDYYRQIIDHMHQGRGFYRAVDAFQPRVGFPTRPFITVREPTLAVISSFVGHQAMGVGLIVLTFVLLIVAMVRFPEACPGKSSWVAACLLCSIAAVPLILIGPLMHEVWSGLLLTFAVLLLSTRHWWLAVPLALLGLLIRELALPVFAVAMVISAAVGRWSRVIVWAITAGFGLAFLAIHAVLVGHDVAPTSTTSLGWLEFGGWPAFVDSIRYSSYLANFPIWFGAVAVPLAVLGWLSRRGELASVVVIVIGMFAVSFSIVGRPENWYWGLMCVVLVLPGLAFVPAAIVDTWRAGRNRGTRTYARE